MPELNANIPPLQCRVRVNYLRDQRDGHGETLPCVVFGVAALLDRAPCFHLLMEDGGVWWRMPISGLCHKADAPETPLEQLVLWNSASSFVTVTQFEALYPMRMSYLDLNETRRWGTYVMTLDWHHPDPNIPDLAYSHDPSQHKCGHVIALDDGNYAIQPNNRVRVFDPSFTPSDDMVVERIVNSHLYSVELADRWKVENTDRFDYGVTDGGM